jgi:hypothetical protein
MTTWIDVANNAVIMFGTVGSMWAVGWTWVRLSQ